MKRGVAFRERFARDRLQMRERRAIRRGTGVRRTATDVGRETFVEHREAAAHGIGAPERGDRRAEQLREALRLTDLAVVPLRELVRADRDRLRDESRVVTPFGRQRAQDRIAHRDARRFERGEFGLRRHVVARELRLADGHRAFDRRDGLEALER